MRQYNGTWSVIPPALNKVVIHVFLAFPLDILYAVGQCLHLLAPETGVVSHYRDNGRECYRVSICSLNRGCPGSKRGLGGVGAGGVL